jgi:hypothetical protein
MEIDNNVQQNIQKKRGRPRKNHIGFIPIKNQEIQKQPKELGNREIILRMPLFGAINSLNNKSFCTNDTNFSNDEKKREDTTTEIINFDINNQSISLQKYNIKDDLKDENKNDAKNNAFTMEDSDNLDNADIIENTILTDETSLGISYTDDTDEKSINNNKLLDELTHKNKLIKQLKIELNEMKKSMPVTYTLGEEVKIIPMQISFVHNISGKTVICDKTTIACWWCTFMFDTLPCFIPERYNDNKFYVFGCFCSFSCASAYNVALGDYKVFDRNSLLIRLYQIITGKYEEIQIAPPKEVLERYGGSITIDEFRNCNKTTISNEYRLILPPMINLISCIEEKPKDTFNLMKKITKVNKHVLDESTMIPVKKIIMPEKKNNIMDTIGIRETVKRKIKFN